MKERKGRTEVSVRVPQPLVTDPERLLPPLPQQPLFALALRALDLVSKEGLVAERVLHEDEREPVVPVAALAPPERRLREEVPQDGDLRVVVALRDGCWARSAPGQGSVATTRRRRRKDGDAPAWRSTLRPCTPRG